MTLNSDLIRRVGMIQWNIDQRILDKFKFMKRQSSVEVLSRDAGEEAHLESCHKLYGINPGDKL